MPLNNGRDKEEILEKNSLVFRRFDDTKWTFLN